MPTGTTSNRSRSRLASTLPAETQEIACSPLRPPNTTATRTRLAMVREGRRSPAHPGARSRSDHAESSFSARRVVILSTASRHSRRGESSFSARRVSIFRTARSPFSGRRVLRFPETAECVEPPSFRGRRVHGESGQTTSSSLSSSRDSAATARLRSTSACCRDGGRRAPPTAASRMRHATARRTLVVHEPRVRRTGTATRRVESRDSACRERRLAVLEMTTRLAGPGARLTGRRSGLQLTDLGQADQVGELVERGQARPSRRSASRRSRWSAAPRAPPTVAASSVRDRVDHQREAQLARSAPAGSAGCGRPRPS